MTFRYFDYKLREHVFMDNVGVSLHVVGALSIFPKQVDTYNKCTREDTHTGDLTPEQRGELFSYGLYSSDVYTSIHFSLYDVLIARELFQKDLADKVIISLPPHILRDACIHEKIYDISLVGITAGGEKQYYLLQDKSFSIMPDSAFKSDFSQLFNVWKMGAQTKGF